MEGCVNVGWDIGGFPELEIISESSIEISL